MSEPFILQLYKEIERKSNIISVSFNNDFYSMTSSNWQQVELVFDKIVGQIGNLLKLENGKIKIGKGIKKVKAISVSLFCNSATLMSGMTQFVVEVIE